MPIRLEKLTIDQKVHVAMKHDGTWAMAAAALKQKNGAMWWPLVVRNSDGTYVMTRFKTVDEAGKISADTLVSALPGLVPVEAVEQDSLGTEAALDKVNAARARLLVVTKGGKFAGTLAPTLHRGAEALPTSKLDNLAGSVVDLSKLGDFLLDET